MDGWMDGRTDGRTDGVTDGQVDGQMVITFVRAAARVYVHKVTRLRTNVVDILMHWCICLPSDFAEAVLLCRIP